MKFMRGHDDARDELRLEARLVELLVLARRRLAIASSWRPKTFTMLWPVCISSTCPLSAPVRSHCAANCFCERFAIGDGHDDRERGSTSSEIGREQRADREHHDQHADDGEHGGDDLREALLQRLRDVVDVVGHARQDVAARVAVEVLERQPRELLVDLPAHAVDDLLRDAGHEVLLQPAEERAQQVDERDQRRASGAARRSPRPRRG